MILYACPDLLFATRIRATAEAAGVLSRAIASPGELDDTDSAAAALFVDLSVNGAMELIAAAAGLSLPVIAFGPHVDRERLEAARAAGAEQALPRSKFTATLDDLVRQYGGVSD